MYLDYGFTRPNVFSRGAYGQQGTDHGSAAPGGSGAIQQGMIYEGSPTPAAPAMEYDSFPMPHPATGADARGPAGVQQVNYTAAQPRALPSPEQASSAQEGGQGFLGGSYNRQADYSTPAPIQ
jgi:hypothetical protein